MKYLDRGATGTHTPTGDQVSIVTYSFNGNGNGMYRASASPTAYHVLFTTGPRTGEKALIDCTDIAPYVQPEPSFTDPVAHIRAMAEQFPDMVKQYPDLFK